MPIKQGVKNSFKKVHGTQKLADVNTGFAVLDVDTRWTSRAEGGRGFLVPESCVL